VRQFDLSKNSALWEPVTLVSTVNGDGFANLASMYSFWILGWTMALGLPNET
jgi:flavin reductase (DIM6/NTAB) family NADH-FMN oxidoreductase RutF